MFLSWARYTLAAHYLPRVTQCVKMLSDEEIWWRPNRASNSVGNLILHLAGNIRQWIISGLGGAPDRRNRDQEFAERGPISSRSLLAQLRKTVAEGCDILEELLPDALSRSYTIQGFQVTGLEAISHVVEHFAYHSGQIILVTKLKRGKDLGFPRLRDEKVRRPGA